MKWARILRRSKTLLTALMLSVFGVLQQYQADLAALLEDPADRTAFIVGVAVVMALLRGVTTKPLSDKGEP